VRLIVELTKLRSKVALLKADELINKKYVEELRSELVFRGVIESDNIIVGEVTKEYKLTCIEILGANFSDLPLRAFDTITKTKGNLFYYEYRSTDIISVSVLRDSRIRISITVDITLVTEMKYANQEVKLCLTDKTLETRNPILSDVFNTDLILLFSPAHYTQLLTLRGDIDLKSTDALMLVSTLPSACTGTINKGSKFTMYEI